MSHSESQLALWLLLSTVLYLMRSFYLAVAWSACSVTPLTPSLFFLFLLIVLWREKTHWDASGSNSNIVDIDINDPLYLHSNDTNGTPLINLKLITRTKNYRVWTVALKHCIHSKNKMGFVDGTCIKPDPETSPFLAMQWERCNSVVLIWILNCVSANLFVCQVFSSNAKTMWDELAETYDKVHGSVTFNLHHKINTLSQNGSKLSDYYHKLNSLWREYDAMVQLLVCTCDGAGSYKDHAQLLKLMQFVMGLDDVYAPIRSNILTTYPLRTVKEAFSLFSRNESYRLSHSGGSGVKRNNSAFVARPSGDSKGSFTSFVLRFSDNRRRFNNTAVRNNNLVCKNFNMTHTIERCFKLIGYTPNFKKKVMVSQNVTSNFSMNGNNIDASGCISHTLTCDQYQRLMNLLVIQDLIIGFRLRSRLGHPTDQFLSVLKDRIDLKGAHIADPCEVCHKAKQTRDPFPLNEHTTSSLEELVHLNVWGQYRVTSRDGFKLPFAVMSRKSEFRAMSSVACEIMWILKVLTELKVDFTTSGNMFCDNKHAKQIAANPFFHERTKHFEINLFFLREKISKGIFKTIKVKSEDNVSDLFTKGLHVQDHKRFCDQLYLVDHFQA
ncbi:putative transcription factor interactor and regulator CCHC(Zn) family protein [Tanacetum coccineum]